VNLFDQLKGISQRKGKMYRFGIANLKSVAMGRGGLGVVVIAVPNRLVLDIDEYVPIVFFVHKDEVKE